MENILYVLKTCYTKNNNKIGIWNRESIEAYVLLSTSDRCSRSVISQVVYFRTYQDSDVL